MFEPLHTLKGPQEAASRPSRDVWLSASAGTGKTQVLAARVLRLLLQRASRWPAAAAAAARSPAASPAAPPSRPRAVP